MDCVVWIKTDIIQLKWREIREIIRNVKRNLEEKMERDTFSSNRMTDSRNSRTDNVVCEEFE